MLQGILSGGFSLKLLVFCFSISSRLTDVFVLHRGLEFLHERCNPPVIHRDLKSSNILLDSNYNAKVRCLHIPKSDSEKRMKVCNLYTDLLSYSFLILALQLVVGTQTRTA